MMEIVKNLWQVGGGPHEGFIGGINHTEPVPTCTRFPQIDGKRSYPERLIITVMGCIISPITRATTWFMSKSSRPGEPILQQPFLRPIRQINKHLAYDSRKSENALIKQVRQAC